MAHKPLTHDEVLSVLKSLQRVLGDRRIHQPVQIRFAAATSGRCWEWRCAPMGASGQHCEWVQIPCEEVR